MMTAGVNARVIARRTARLNATRSSRSGPWVVRRVDRRRHQVEINPVGVRDARDPVRPCAAHLQWSSHV
jgi:hypothetical protein